MKTTTLLFIFLITIFGFYSCSKPEDPQVLNVESVRDLILDNSNISPDSLTVYMVDSALNASNYRFTGVEIIPAWNNWSQDAHNEMEQTIQKRNRYNTVDLLDMISDYGQPSGWDFDQSGTVSLKDVLTFLGGYGTTGAYLSDYQDFDSIQWYYNDSLVYTGNNLLLKTGYQDGFFPQHEGNLLITCRVFANNNIIERSGYSFFSSSDPLYDEMPYYNEGSLSNLYVGPFQPYQYFLNLTTD